MNSRLARDSQYMGARAAVIICRLARQSFMAIALAATMVPRISAAADPQESDGLTYLLSGFGTLGVVHSSNRDADFTSNILAPTGAGYTRPWSVDPDSRIGAQLTVTVAPRLSAVLQVIAEQRYDNTYTPHVEWANLAYQMSPELTVRVGRIVLPSFLVSGSRKVSYSNPWVRPPLEVYNLVPVTNSDGVDASYTAHFGAVTHTVIGTFGTITPKLPTGGTAAAKRVWLVADTVEIGAATFHVAYNEARLTVDSVNAVMDAFGQFGPQGEALERRYDLDSKLVRFIGLGAMYDPGRWFAMAEWGRSDFDSAIGKSTGWYATAGYRVAKLTPYMTYGAVKADSNTSDPGLTISQLPSELVGPATRLNAALNAVLGSIAVQRTMSVGTRWDAADKIACKLQFDHTRLGAGSAGALINVQPGFLRGGTVNVVSLSVDFLL
jgi:hypothetical protein